MECTSVVAFIPLLTIFLTLDSMMSAVKYLLFSPVRTPCPTLSVSVISLCANRDCLQARSFNLFLNPPDPTPAALLLPPSEKPMNHVRPKSGDSFFAPPRTTIRPDTVAPPAALLPGADLDPETRRWLAAYPADPDLVPLIAGLRQGKENDDFILSDVGLLYLRPEDDEPALLVPPAGSIRHELLTDAHLQSETGSGHSGAGEMLDQLGEVFWWMKMEVDVRAFCEGCVECKAKVRELGPGMTSLPFTGVTGWAEMGEGKTAGPGESAMAAEMAFAMRRAEEEAERDALG